MRVEDLTIEQFAFQVDYPDSYWIWDRAGMCAEELQKIWSGLELESRSDGEVALKKPGVKIVSGIRVSYVHVMNPKGFGRFREEIAKTIDQWRSVLEIGSYKRIGCRVVLFKDFESSEAARKYLRDTGLVRWPRRDVFNISSKSALSAPVLAFRFEDESVAAVIKIGFQDLKIELKGEGAFEDRSEERESHRLVVDVDRYTKLSTESRTFSARDWLEGFEHLVRRDLPEIFGTKQ